MSRKIELLEELLAIAKEEEKEEEKQNSKNEYKYMFVYEQKYNDAPGWGPNTQIICASSVGQAFMVFGRVIDAYGLTVRNIRYGLWDEMQEEEDKVREYWKEHRERKNK